jgi:hypothetical protein
LTFTGDTLVQMAVGPPHRIADVQVGDRVKSRDPQAGVEGVKTVTATINRLAPALVHLSLTEAKTGKSETLTCTPEHPLFVSGRGWVAAGSLGIGSLIVSRAGPLLSVSSVTWEREAAGGADGGGPEDKPYTVYNLTVEDDHTYFVGTVGGGTWVHNAGCIGTADELFSVSGKAPWHTAPGTDTLEGEYVNDIQQVQPWRAHYDQFGRQIGRTDYNAGNPVDNIADTHYHTYGYNNGIRYPILDHVPGVFMP